MAARKTKTSQRPEKDEKGRFLSGNNGGPGRPKGSRNKLTEAFWDDLHAAWTKQGKDAIDRMIAEKPGDFVRVVASQMPKELNVNTSPLNDLSDDELAGLLDAVRGLVASARGSGDRTEAETRH